MRDNKNFLMIIPDYHVQIIKKSLILFIKYISLLCYIFLLLFLSCSYKIIIEFIDI